MEIRVDNDGREKRSLATSAIGISGWSNDIIGRIGGLRSISIPDYINVSMEGLQFGSILTTSGQLIFSEVDCTLPGPIPFQIVRTYYSRNPGKYDGCSRWMFNFMKRIMRVPVSASECSYMLITSNGTGIAFQPCGEPGRWDPPSEREMPYSHIQADSDGDKLELVFRDKTIQVFCRKPGIHPLEYGLRRIEDEWGNYLFIEYNAHGEPVEIKNSDTYGNTRSSAKFLYENGKLTGVRHELREARYSYNNAGNIERFIDFTGDITEYSYDSRQRIKKIRKMDDEKKHEIVFYYNSKNQLKRFDHAGKSCRIKYDDSWGKTTVIGPDNGIHTFYYDSSGKTVRIVSPRGEIMMISMNNKDFLKRYEGYN